MVTTALVVSIWFAPAAASTYVASVGDPVPLPIGGLWARAEPAESGWDFFWASGGGLRHGALSDDLTLDERASVELTGRTDLMDHHISRCEDGTWLHLASAAVNAPNDTAYGFRYDAAFNRVEEAVVIPTTTEIRTNDMAVVCVSALQAVGFSGIEGADVVYSLDAALSPSPFTNADTLPQLMGGSLVWEEERATMFAVGRAYGRPLTGQSIDLEGRPVGEVVELPLAGEGEDAYWPQGLLRVGDHWLMAYMWRLDDGTFSQDTGNVRLAVLDLDWNVLEVVPLTDYPAPNGAMRPWITRKGDQALVTFDIDQVPTVLPLTLDLAALGETEGGPGDTGETGDTGDTGDSGETDDSGESGDTSERTDTADTGGSGKDGGCGCGAPGPASSSTAVLLALLTIGRRYSRES